MSIPSIEDCVITTIFAAMLYTLISIVLQFRNDNLTLSRSNRAPWQSDSGSSHDQENETDNLLNDRDTPASAMDRSNLPDSPLVAAGTDERSKQEVEEASSGNDDDDWEDVGSTELEAAFDSASTLVASCVSLPTIPGATKEEIQLQLYGLYKQATEGSSSAVSQPSMFNIRARAKWDAWNKFSGMSEEEAMAKYIHLVHRVFAVSNELLSHDSNSPDQVVESAHKSGMGPVFSSLAGESQTSADAEPTSGILDVAREGDLDSLTQLLTNGAVDINEADSEGRTAVHWAADRGHLHIMDALIRHGANLDAQDSEGQTALHYAAVCEYKSVYDDLIRRGARTDIKDSDGQSSMDLQPKQWT